MTRIFTLLWLVFVTAISMMPLKLKYRAGTTGVLHEPGHFFIFLVTSLLLCRTGSARLFRAIGVCGFAFIMETLEWQVYHNSFEWRDVLIDSLGAMAGFFLVSTFPWRGRYTPGREERNSI